MNSTWIVYIMVGGYSQGGGGASAINETLLYVAVAKYSLEESTQVKESKTHSPSEKR